MVYLDGYAGEGRHESGEPASVEIPLRVASYFRARGRTVECFFTEAQQKSFEKLQQVVEQYRARGVPALTAARVFLTAGVSSVRWRQDPAGPVKVPRCRRWSSSRSLFVR